MFGNWSTNLNSEFINAEPYEHVLIENFFTDDYAQKITSQFPDLANPNWFRYHNPIEKKYALNNFKDLPEFTDLFSILQSDQFISKISAITSIPNLENDPHLHGAGLHYHPKGGKLDMHLDYSIHPISAKERRVNLIIYLNKEWHEEYNGALELWDKDFTGPVKKYYPKYNTAILFRTNNISYHGLPTPINCPENCGRKSLAIYYVSDQTNDAQKRFKAEYRPLPIQHVNDKLRQLYTIRKTRCITTDDLEKIYPNWEIDGNGFW
jgi:Rps23 Pro-64 3,4-dihydroxylase Tpa1-like proline 4-hydroxylase